MITSPHNDNLTQVRKLAGRKWRDKLGEFVAEGEDLVEAAAAAGWPPSALYVAAGSGKLHGRHAFSSHILEKKSPKRKREFSKDREISKADRQTVTKLLGGKHT